MPVTQQDVAVVAQLLTAYREPNQHGVSPNLCGETEEEYVYHRLGEISRAQVRRLIRAAKNQALFL